jgi:replicative DNA helicase
MSETENVKMIYWSEVWDRIEEERKAIDFNKIPSFGITLLDEALDGMLKNDLVVIGSDSGVGKSDLCLNMALHNAMRGLKVGLYYIEGGANEAIYRIKWKMICDEYYSNQYQFIDMDYRKWRMNKIKSLQLDEIELKCYQNLYQNIKDNIVIADIKSGMTVQDLNQSFLSGFTSIKKVDGWDTDSINADLIIIDHLQYFDLVNPKNEYAEMTQILKQVNNIVQFYKVPVVLVSHLRKKDKERGLPSQEDFFGTSNIPKISSISITVCPDFEDQDCEKNVYPTWFRIVKSRTGIRSNIAARAFFDTKLSKYRPGYELFKLIDDRPFKELLPSERPKYAVNVKESHRTTSKKQVKIKWEE